MARSLVSIVVATSTDLIFADYTSFPLPAPLSSHAARIATLSKQIATLEAENVAPKPWALSGEASSRSRPINAILEEDLEFENVSKQVPVVTEERVKGLEDKIKQRILNVSLFYFSFSLR